MTDLAKRYGAPSPQRRRTLIALVGVLAALGLAWLAWAAVYQSTPQVRSELKGFEVVDAHTAKAVLIIDRDSSDVVATCIVRAVSEDHQVVGEANLVIRGGAEDQNLDITIRTERRATTVERLGCTAPGQPQRK